MTRALQVARIALLLTAAGLCAFTMWFQWDMDRKITARLDRIDATLAGMAAAAQQAAILEQNATATLQSINRPCGTGKPCGTLADVAKTLGTIRLTAGQVEIAANHEDKRIGIMDAQETQIAGDTHALLAKAGGDLDTLDRTILGLQPIETEAQVEVVELQRATKALTALESDPNLTATAKNLNAASAHASDALLHVDGTTADVQQAVYSYLHPTMAQKIWHAVADTGVEVGKFFF
jgi:hypothetical protein